MKNQKGITLIALIITIIVMLILVGVSVSVALNTGLFKTAGDTAKNTQKAAEAETALSNGTIKIEGQEGEISIDEYVASLKGENGGEYEAISVETDCVGYYVDLGGAEGPEGVVYIDIAKTQSGSWNGTSYTITNQTEGLKEYYVSAEEYEGDFGTKPVLSLIPGTTGTERFYVMALEDSKTADSTTFYWYYNAIDQDTLEGKITDYATGTGIGAGKTNTETMLTKWNAETYGAKDAQDMWGLVETGWYIPSKEEWAAFGSTMEITSSNYSSKGLSDWYWSSSLYNPSYGSGTACFAYFDTGRMDGRDILNNFFVRLSTTF